MALICAKSMGKLSRYVMLGTSWSHNSDLCYQWKMSFSGHKGICMHKIIYAQMLHTVYYKFEVVVSVCLVFVHTII